MTCHITEKEFQTPPLTFCIPGLRPAGYCSRPPPRSSLSPRPRCRNKSPYTACFCPWSHCLRTSCGPTSRSTSSSWFLWNSKWQCSPSLYWGGAFYQENRKQSFLGFRCICDTPKGPVGIGIELSPSPLLFSSAYVTGFPIFFHAKWDSVFIG